MKTAYISIGSNLGNRQGNAMNAIELMAKHPYIDIRATSNWYETPALAIDHREQADYLNGVVQVHTSLDPMELLDELQLIERKLGRPAIHGMWQPRTIDLDILVYDRVILKTNRLTLPHPEMTKRMFVLRPLCDIAPALVHPMTGKTVREMVRTLETRGES